MELPIEVRAMLTPSQLRRFNELTEFEQQSFLYEISKHLVKPTTLLILTILGIHYIYLKQIGKQFKFWFTLGGLVIWYLLDLINYRKKAEEHNQSIIQRYL
jgi:TM2 domain-containing membrane protein YozV